MNVLLAEHDAALADGLMQHLLKAAFRVEWTDNGAVAEYLLQRREFDVAVVNLGLPMVPGLQVIERSRAAGRQLPLMALAGPQDDKLAALKIGADDVLTQPFDFAELEARLHALLRRSRASTPVLELRGFSLDRGAHQAKVAGQVVELSPREWALAEVLLTQRGKVVSKAGIVQAWSGTGGESDGAGSIEVYVHRLRRKLEGSDVVIRSARGVGYVMESGRA
jgi:two-component system OmpR family response regulator